MVRRFNTGGPCLPRHHYMVPAAPRLPEVPDLVEELAYFVVHAPRQSGKTTTLRAIAARLTEQGQYAALLFSCQSASAAGQDYVAAQRTVLSEIAQQAQLHLPDMLRPPERPTDVDGGILLGSALTAWARICPRPLVLFFDEIDALIGQSLISVLSQLRTGFSNRPEAFPASVGLCGLRNVREYKVVSGGSISRMGTSSPFNIPAESLRVGNFEPEEVDELYRQHTQDIGQKFDPDAVRYAFELTDGQPWLVNALARQTLKETGLSPDRTIVTADLERAKERLIRDRAVHLDQLAHTLDEPRVRKIIEPMITGEYAMAEEAYDDDVRYVIDLGLVRPLLPLEVANPIYREVILRVLGSSVDRNFQLETPGFVSDDGRLNFGGLLREFASFWKQHGEVLTDGAAYHEAAPQLVLMAYLHRVINGGGQLEREYGIGRGRIDLHLRWRYRAADGDERHQREAMEVKVWRPERPDPVAEGLRQLDAYLDRLELDSGTLVVFDRRSNARPIHERTYFEESTSAAGRKVTVLRG